MPPKAKGAAKKKNGYQMPEKFNEGFALKDIYKTTWTLGTPIGQGGFGLIYLASKGESKIKNPDNAEYVIKIEPKDNGPLFCETHFYINCAKEDDIKTFIRAKGLKHLAMPRYISSGLCTYNEKEYRFLVMDRYVKDLQSVLNTSNTHQINEIGVMCIMRQILFSLEYIHQKGYAHGDIKGANIMLKSDSESYLVDFGLAYRFQRDDLHQKYDVKPERRHNGTIEYTSRDAHDGAQTYRRSDLEILGYCVMHWLSGTLPWIDLITKPEQVQQSKKKSMDNVKEFVKNLLSNCSEPSKIFMEYYLDEVNKLNFDSEPSYSKIHLKLTETLRLLGHSSNSSDNFSIFKPSSSKTSAKSTPAQKKKALEAAANIDQDDTVEKEVVVKRPAGNRRKRPEYLSDNEVDIDEDIRDDEAKSSRSNARTETPKTKASTRTPNPRSSKKNPIEAVVAHEANLNEISEIKDDFYDDGNYAKSEKTRSSKKQRNYLQSTAIEPTLSDNYSEHSDKVKLKLMLDEKPTTKKTATPVATTVSTSSTASTTPAKLNIVVSNNGVKITSNSPIKIANLKENKTTISDDPINGHHVYASPRVKARPNYYESSEDIISIEDIKVQPKTDELRTPKSSLKTSTNVDPLSKFKQANNLAHTTHQPTPRSPLAVANLDKANGCILVKKRKNVPKATVSTQTDESYLSTHIHKFRNF